MCQTPDKFLWDLLPPAWMQVVVIGEKESSYFFFKPVFATSQLLAFRIHGSSSSRRIRTHLQHLLPLEQTWIFRIRYALHRRRQKRDVLYSIFMINKIDSGLSLSVGRSLLSLNWLTEWLHETTGDGHIHISPYHRMPVHWQTFTP